MSRGSRVWAEQAAQAAFHPAKHLLNPEFLSRLVVSVDKPAYELAHFLFVRLYIWLHAYTHM